MVLLQVVYEQVELGSNITPGEAMPTKHIRALADPSMPKNKYILWNGQLVLVLRASDKQQQFIDCTI